MLRIYLFGPPRFERDDGPILVNRRKGVALLSYLIQANQPTSRETLAALFWPEHSQAEALKSLRRELSRLKKSLGEDSIVATSGQLALNSGADVDTVRFQQKLKLVREHDHFLETECPSCLDALSRAVDSYTDSFMAGFNLLDCPEFDAWQDYQRENFRYEQDHALHLLARWYMFQGREDQVFHYCRRLLALDPLNETVHRLLMQANIQSGRPAAALREYEEFARLLQERMGVEPAEEIRQFYEDILKGNFPNSEEMTVTPARANNQPAPPVVRRRRSNLPQQPTPFVGRQRELMMIQLRLQEPACRLLTLIGPGGFGKTRLALKVGQSILEGDNPLFSGGVLFVPLATADTPLELITAILDAATVPSFESRPLANQMFDFLQDKKMLLILDNIEHLLEASEIIQTILAEAPGVRILATSRVALRLQEEWFHPVGGMLFPPKGVIAKNRDEKNSLTAYDAVQLFEKCARNATPEFSLSEDLEFVVRICRLVEGMPLALEMAAVWLKVMDTSAIANELRHNLDLLDSRFRNMPHRHKSIQAVFDQTWAMLEPDERLVLARLSIFNGGFTREAAYQVAGADLFLLSNLIEKALLVTTTHGHYRLHELLRQFAFKKLREMNHADKSRADHCRYYMKLLAELEPVMKGARQAQAFNQIKENLENIRLAWNQALERTDLESLSNALETIYLYFFIRGRNHEGVDFLQSAALKLSPTSDGKPEKVWGRILIRICLLKSHLLPDVKVGEEIQIALSIAHQYQDPVEIALCKFAEGIFYTLIREDAKAAIQAYEQALQIYRSLNDTFYLVRVLLWLGFCRGNNAQLDLYYEYNRQALDLARTAGHRAGASHALGNLVAWAFCTGDYAAAEQYAHEVGAIGVELDLPNMINHSKAQLCLAYFLKGDIDRAGELARETHAMALDIHLPLSIAYALAFLGLHANMKGDYLAAKQLGEESLTMPAPRFGMIIAHWTIAIACCGLGQDEAAWEHILKMLEMSHQDGFQGMTTWSLPVIAVIQARAGHNECAVHMFALAQSHPLSPTGWQKQWSIPVQWLGCLKSELGEEKFAATWKRGQALALESVVIETLSTNGRNADEPTS
jgi:predicted ATPase/DNA-binding SARP family transcriptional activator